MLNALNVSQQQVRGVFLGGPPNLKYIKVFLLEQTKNIPFAGTKHFLDWETLA